MPPYDQWAEFYDFSEGDRSIFIDFYSSLITDSTRSLLDLGCGTGMITTVLAERIAKLNSGYSGIRITGLDESSEMLRIARARDTRIEWVHGNFCSPRVNGRYDLVISCFYVLHNLLTEDELAATFRAVRQLLTSQGVFAFDLYQPNLPLLSQPRSKLIRSVTSECGQLFEVRDDWSFDAVSRVLTVDRRLVPAGEPDAALGNLRMRLRQYFPDDINRLLAGAGLSIVQRFGDFDRSPFTSTAGKQVLVCRGA
jgi:ubiquinone/menaquinone biosynthesis C-methylase UbiE